MNAANGPQEQADRATCGPDDAQVIPFPRGGRDGRKRTADWIFITDVRWVNGAEGDWLRKELAGVVRDLLVWARDDVNSAELEKREEQGWAA